MIGSIRRHPIIATIVTLPLVCVLAIAGLLAAWLSGAHVPFASGAEWFKLEKVASADYTPAPNKPVFILIIGNDGRPGDTSTRGDAIHLIGVNPMLHKATMLDIPRDTGMDIPGHGLDKVNAAHVDGGPRLQAETIGNAVGVQIPYVLDTNFQGFVGLVNDMGGININIPTPMNDVYSGAHFAPGQTHLDGGGALEFSRDRHDFPTGDLMRSQNQGYLILSALTQLRAQNPGPIGTIQLLATLGRHVTLDGVGLDDLYVLGRLGLSIDPNNVRNVVIPVGQGAGTRLSMTPAASGLFADFADDAVLESH